MVEVSQKRQDELPRIKENINTSRLYYQNNYYIFNNFKKFTCKTGLSDSEIAVLSSLSKPQVQFNITEAYISRLRGEFSKQEPGFSVSADDSNEKVDPQSLEIIEGILRHILFEANTNSFSYDTYTDMLFGFSSVKLGVEYKNEFSFQKQITFKKAYDPVMCGFDPQAVLPHKGDGNYAFEIYPMTENDFKNQYPNINTDDIKFSRQLEGFSWSYKSAKNNILLVADYYEKKKKRIKIYELANNTVVSEKQYKIDKERWESEFHIEQYPVVVKERFTTITEICRYVLIENKILEYTKTDFCILPIVYAGGNSVILRDPDSNEVEELARPYTYHAADAQKLKNYAGQCLANELENMIQHKFMVAKEGIPDEEDYQEAYRDVQHADTVVYNAFLNYNPSAPTPPIPIPPPSAVPRVPMPPEITQAFTLADQTIQNILGSYDAALGINNNQLSGIAIVEAATQSNSAAMPYIVSFMQMMSQLAKGALDLILKYYKTPMSVPIITKEGKRKFVKINGKGQPKICYSSNELNVKVEPDVNFNIQKNRALQQIIALSQASPTFAQFINSKGLSIILENLDIRGADKLKNMVNEWMQEQQMQLLQQQKQQQINMQNNPMLQKVQLEQAKLQEQIRKNNLDNQLKQQELQNDAMQNQIAMTQAHNDTIKIALDAKELKDSSALEMAKIEERKEGKAIDILLDMHERHHNQTKDAIETAHKIDQANQKSTSNEIAEDQMVYL